MTKKQQELFQIKANKVRSAIAELDMLVKAWDLTLSIHYRTGAALYIDLLKPNKLSPQAD